MISHGHFDLNSSIINDEKCTFMNLPPVYFNFRSVIQNSFINFKIALSSDLWSKRFINVLDTRLLSDLCL